MPKVKPKGPPMCNFCGKLATAAASLHRCTGCKAVYYCNRTCQRGDWPGHKIFCKKFASWAAKAEADVTPNAAANAAAPHKSASAHTAAETPAAGSAAETVFTAADAGEPAAASLAEPTADARPAVTTVPAAGAWNQPSEELSATAATSRAANGAESQGKLEAVAGSAAATALNAVESGATGLSGAGTR